jgi:membrane-associated phospholipid phosphatase
VLRTGPHVANLPVVPIQPREIDGVFSRFARRKRPGPAARAVARLASPWPVFCEGLAVASALRACGRPAVAAAAAAPLADVAGKALKKMTHRSRPGRARFGKNGNESFPSTHVTGPLALLVCASCLAPPTRAWRAGLGAGAAAVVFIAAERICAGKHWASDVVVGAALGIATGALLGRAASARGAPSP